MNGIVTIEIDLAKNIFPVDGVEATGKPSLARPSVPRTKLNNAQIPNQCFRPGADRGQKGTLSLNE